MSKFDDIERARAAREATRPKVSPSLGVVEPSYVNRDSSEQAVWSHRERAAALPSRRQLEREANRILSPDAGRIPVKIQQRLLNILDSEPRTGLVTHDSGEYCPIPGRPLPPIKWFEVPKSMLDS